MTTLRNITLTIFFVLNIFQSFAQELISPMFNQADFSHLGVKNIQRVDWDSNSLMWFVSEKGLSKYNGNSVEHFGQDSLDTNTPLSNNIISLKVDSKDQIWLSYIDTIAVSRFDISQKKFFHYTNKEKPLVPKGVVVKVKRIDESRVVLCSWGGGFSILDYAAEESKHFERNEEKSSKTVSVSRVKDIAIINDDQWVITYFTEKGFRNVPSIFNPKTEVFKDFPIDRYTHDLSDELKGLIAKNLEVVNFIHVDKNGNYWFGTYSGLIHLNNEDSIANRVLVDSSKLYTQNLVNARDYEVDKNGLLWVSTSNSGVLLVNQNTLSAKYIKHDPNNFNSLASNASTLICNDNLGNTWVNSGRTNFSVYNPYFQNFQISSWDDLPLTYTNQSGQNIPVNQMYTSEDGVIYLSNGNGLISYYSRSGIYKVLINVKDYPLKDHSSKDGIQNFKIKNNKIYYGNDRGFFIFDIEKGEYVDEFSNTRLQPLFTHDKSDKSMYFFHKSKVYFLTPEHTLEHAFTFPEKFTVVTLGNRILPDGRWLLNTRKNGLLIIDPSNWTYTNVSVHDEVENLPDPTINCSEMLDDNNYWIGTEKGMYKLNLKSNNIQYVGDEIGLGEQSIRSMQIDNKGILWLALREKLYKWDDKLKKGFSYSRSTGLKSGEFLPSFGQKSVDGRMFFVARNGILKFDPESLLFPSQKLEIMLDELLVNDKDIEDSVFKTLLFNERKLKFDWDENRLIFKFGNNQHFVPTEHEYFYRLKGVHNEWQSNGNSNILKFSGLGYGDYLLEVKAVNSYNQESSIAAVKFKIQTPFWFSIWFYLAIGVSIIFIVILVVRLREKKMVRQKKKLEQTIQERTAEVLEKAAEIKSQKDIIEAKNIELTDSIIYAERIQNAILPAQKKIEELLNEVFVYYQPKEIVAGDFYWVQPMNKLKKEVFFAAADCTGHGVPGAIVSVICNNALNRSLREFKGATPAEILNTTRRIVVQEFEKSDRNVQDGMDIALCKLNNSETTNGNFNLEFSGANNPLIIVRKKSKAESVLHIRVNGSEDAFLEPNKESEEYVLFEIKADKQPIGLYIKDTPFTNFGIKTEKGDMIYLFSDGYPDQFGKLDHSNGSESSGKKLKTGNFKNILLSMQALEVDKQKELLLSEFEKWRGPLEQIDDVCVLGVKV